MEGAPTRRIIEVVNKCPTQALAWKYNKDLTEEERNDRQSVAEELTPRTISQGEKKKEKPTNIRIMKDGPIVVDGNFKIIGADNSELRKAHMTSFCRCGNSRSMPYCDGSHRKIGFTE